MTPTSSFRVADDSFMTRQLDRREKKQEKMQPPLWHFDMHDILLIPKLLWP